MLQAFNAIETFIKLKTRATDLADLKGHLLRVFNRSREFISRFPSDRNSPDPADATFILAGYSWRSKQFRIWKLHFDVNIQKYTFRPTHPWLGQEGEPKLIAFVGDEEAVSEARKQLITKLRINKRLAEGGLNMEPFEVLRDIIRSEVFPSVGLATIGEALRAHEYPPVWRLLARPRDRCHQPSR